MSFLCPNSTCSLLFFSIEQVISHLSDNSVSCGSLLANQGQNLDDDLELIDIDSNSEGSWEEVPVGPLFLFLVDFHVANVSPDEYPFSPFAENIASDQDVNVLYNFTPPAPLPPKQYINDFLPSSDGITRHKEYHPNRAQFKLGGENLLQHMDRDPLSKHRKTNVHYPFADRTEWELAQWLNTTSLTQQQINSFLRLDYVSHLSYNDNKRLNKTRFEHIHHHFLLLVTYALVLRPYLQFHAGNIKSFYFQDIKQNRQWLYIGVTGLRSLLSYSPIPSLRIV
jgi:hypothetical protein